MTPRLLLALLLTAFCAPLSAAPVVFAEKDGLITIEAEQFHKQTLDGKRAWHITSAAAGPKVEPDGDAAHTEGASGGAYIEALPDTRRSHDDKLVKGENFTDEPGAMAVLHYKIHVSTPGRYFVWARTFSTTSEDNGLHFGLDGKWPASGQRWQTVKKNGWHWDCRQRTAAVHAGVLMQLWLDIEKAGEHELLLSMREDGAEVDRIILAKSADFRPPGVDDRPDNSKGNTQPQNFPLNCACPTAAVPSSLTVNPGNGIRSPLRLIALHSRTRHAANNTGGTLAGGCEAKLTISTP